MPVNPERQSNILIVEDNPGDARLIRELLREVRGGDFNLLHADRLSSGMEYLATNDIKLVLLDLGLPDSQGLDTFLRTQAQVPEKPIVVLSGLDDEDMAMQAVAAGAQDYLVKGQVDGSLLVRAIRYAIERKKIEEKLRGALLELKISHASLEQRTTDLAKANEFLNKEIGQRKRAEEKLQKTLDQLKQSQFQLVQAEKMAATGMLTAGIAHELNNPMMGILNFIQFSLKHISEPEAISPVLQDGERETRRCIDIVRNLLTFSHSEKGPVEKSQKMDCAVIFERVFRLLSYRTEKEGVLITQRYAEELPDIWVRPSSIQQVFLNLIGNALDAVKEEKKKEIYVDVRPDGEFVRIVVADSGCGVTAENLNKIFDPFFTTKPPGVGTGLGLAVSRSIVQAQGGQISCESKPGSGTKFTVLLPVERRRQV